MDEQTRARFPEYAKYYDRAKEGKSETIGEFIEWMQNSPYVVMEWKKYTDFGVNVRGETYEYETEGHLMVNKSVEEWLCDFYGIDYHQAIKEKDENMHELLAGLKVNG